MPVDVIMPQMGESIQEGTVVKWLKKPGDKVGRDEPLFEISTDKVDAEIPSPAAGILKEIKVKEGETVAIKTVVAIIDSEGAGAAKEAPAPAPATTPASAPASAQAPARAAAPAPPAPAARPAPAAAAPSPAARGELVSLEDRLRTKSSPVVRKIAAEHGVDIASLSGSGISGRVTKRDILEYVEGGGQAAAAAAAPAPMPAQAPAAEPVRTYPAFQPGERIERVAMTPMRRKIAEHMVTSRKISAHVTTVFEIDMSRVAKIRAAKKDAFIERHGVNLSFMPFIFKAAIDGLNECPEVNASIDGTDIIYKKDINLGMAVALDWGLIVPVIKNAQDLSIAGLAKATNDLATRARNKQLKPEEVSGGTFTITNPGVFGSLFGTPIINQPQVAILGVGTIEKRPVVRDDAIAIRTMAYFGISYDHRLVDGAMADKFMNRLKKTLEEFDEATV